MYSSDEAEVLAIRAVTWLIGEEDCLHPFLAQTGATIEDVKLQINQSGFLGAALDFILQRDDWVVSCSNYIEIVPENLQILRAAFAGGETMNWT